MSIIEQILLFIDNRITWNEEMKEIDPKPSDIGRIEEDKCIRRYIEKLIESGGDASISKEARASFGMVSNFGPSNIILDVDLTQEELEKLSIVPFCTNSLKINIPLNR